MIRKQHLNRRFGSILPRDKGKSLLTKCLVSLYGVTRNINQYPNFFLQSKITSDLTLAYLGGIKCEGGKNSSEAACLSLALLRCLRIRKSETGYLS